MSSDVDRVKDRIDIAEVIGSYVELEESGSNLRAKCPFHNENTPSFFVSPDRGLYYCFGCGAKGDVFTFVQEFEGLDFYGALKLLARKAGVELTGGSQEARDQRKRLYEVLEMATVYFESRIRDHQPAREYLESRGIQEQTIRNFRLGYAQDAWRKLHDHLKEKGVSEEEMEAVGLIKKSKKKGRYYDRFRGRIIFPIMDAAGRVVGFSGRLLEEKEKAPKYLNSPETELFKKSSVLYGYDKAKRAMRSNDFCILVEGQIDLVLAHQAGYANTVAVSGSSITAHHLQLVDRMTSNLLLAFDSDAAGMKSERSAAQVGLSMGMDVKVVQLPEDADPADVISQDRDQWRDLVRGAEHVIERHLAYFDQVSDDRRSFWRQVRSHVLPLVARIPDSIDRSHFISVVRKETGIPESSIKEELQKVDAGNPAYREESRQRHDTGDDLTQAQAHSRKRKVMEKLKGILRWQDESDESVIDVTEIQDRIADILDEDTLDMESVAAEAALKAEVAYEDLSTLADEVDELVLHLEMEHTREKYLAAMKKLREEEKSSDSDGQQELLVRCQELSQHLHEVKERLQSH